MSTIAEPVTGEVTELLQQLIRNECVNDGREESGQEVRSADLLATYLEGSGLDLERYDLRTRKARGEVSGHRLAHPQHGAENAAGEHNVTA